MEDIYTVIIGEYSGDRGGENIMEIKVQMMPWTRKGHSGLSGILLEAMIPDLPAGRQARGACPDLFGACGNDKRTEFINEWYRRKL
jgi:hypothetical protein